jgi:hypothetical protein
MTRPYHSQLRQRQGCDISATIEQQGGGRDLFQQVGIGGIIGTNQVIAGHSSPVQPQLYHRQRPSELPYLGRVQTLRPQTSIIALKQGFYVTIEGGKQAGGSDRAYASNGIQHQPQ